MQMKCAKALNPPLETPTPAHDSHEDAKHVAGRRDVMTTGTLAAECLQALDQRYCFHRISIDRAFHGL